MSAIYLQGIEKWFDNSRVLKGLDFEIKEGEFIVLVGPSGCGKSTLLRILAGLEEASKGSIIIDGENVSDKVPSERGLSMVFQSYALYPHMNVSENIGFALKTAGYSKSKIQSRVSEVAVILRLEELLDRLPKQLSGGQRQRVAIGRAIARQPKGFLFDEPLSNLDSALRVKMRLEISRLHEQLGITTVYVTHDQVEAMTLADRIVVLNEGKIMQAGSPRELYIYPLNKFVAEFIGSPKMNLIKYRKGKDTSELLAKIIKRAHLSMLETNIEWFGIRPEHITLCAPSKTRFRGTIMVSEYLGSEQYIYVDCGFEDLISIQANPAKEYAVGSEVGLLLNDKSIHLFDFSENRINL